MRQTILLIIFGALVGVFVARSQAGKSYGATGIGPIAPDVTQCPKPTKGYAFLCPAGSAGNFSMYVSYDGGPYALLP